MIGCQSRSIPDACRIDFARALAPGLRIPGPIEAAICPAAFQVITRAYSMASAENVSPTACLSAVLT